MGEFAHEFVMATSYHDNKSYSVQYETRPINTIYHYQIRSSLKMYELSFCYQIYEPLYYHKYPSNKLQGPLKK